MHYTQTKSESAELLRLVVPQLATRGSGCQPTSYALWYEYVAGLNPDLVSAVDGRVSGAGSLSEEDTRALYGKFIANRDFAALDEAQVRLQHGLEGLMTLSEASGRDVRLFDDSLKVCGEHLDAAPGDANALRGTIATLVMETHRMRRSNEELDAQLKDSKRELEDMTTQLLVVRSEYLLDPLTRLKNRRGLQLGLEQLAAELGGLNGCSLLVADIDYFKRVNDTFGHLFGDKVLRAVGQSLHACTKGRDLLARFGGEEFVVILPDTKSQGAIVVAEQIRRRIASGRIRRHDGVDDTCGITVSLGVAEHVEGETFDQWMERGDGALYQSKQNGRDRVTLAPRSVERPTLDSRALPGL